jgi:hypothetical protein
MICIRNVDTTDGSIKFNFSYIIVKIRKSEV